MSDSGVKDGGPVVGGIGAHEAMDIRAILDTVVEVVEPLARSKGLNVASRCGADVPARVQGDTHAVQEVLIALARSAVEATDAGFVAISSRQVTLADGSRAIEFMVRDTSTRPHSTGSATARPGTSPGACLQFDTQPGEGTTARLVILAEHLDDPSAASAAGWKLGMPGRA
jgi:hypothetical protein